MIRKIQKLKNRKGFTLVEVIIVLVILAILAAVLIPSLTGYIDKANEKTLVFEAKHVFQAAQTTLSEVYAMNKSEFVTYVKGKSLTVQVPLLEDDGSIKVNSKGETQYGPKKKTGRISNSSLYNVQNGVKGKATDRIDEEMGKQILKYLESDNKSSAMYKFNTSGVRLGKDSKVTTADGYFKTNTKDDVAFNIYYNETGHVTMVHFAKRGINKIVEVGASGSYTIVDSIKVTG